MTDALNSPPRPLARRRFLGLGGLTTIGVGLALAGCDTSPASTTAQAAAGSGGSAAAGSLGELKYAFSWLYDVTQAGPYIADTKGYYTKAGFSSVKFIPGGPSAVPVPTQLLSGAAQFGVSDPSQVAAANNNGASIRIIGAMYQKSPVCIVSLPSKPLKTPADLKGKTIGVADSDKPSLLAFLSINGLKPADMKLVPFQYDPAPLIDGQLDGFVGYSTQDPISLQESGHQAVILMYSDFGFETVYQTYVATADAISGSRDVLKAALRADIMGWQGNIANPEEGASLTVTKYGKSLKYSLQNQLAADKAGIVLMKTPDTQRNGILSVTSALQSQTVKTLALSGAQTTVGDLFDMSLLTEIYQEHPELKSLA
jgi:ABC-type nitrate/sulfonate/bicarbonate transport system substrate-binding protein